MTSRMGASKIGVSAAFMRRRWSPWKCRVMHSRKVSGIVVTRLRRHVNVRWVAFIGQFWPQASLTSGITNTHPFHHSAHGELCLPTSCAGLHFGNSRGIRPANLGLPLIALGIQMYLLLLGYSLHPFRQDVLYQPFNLVSRFRSPLSTVLPRIR